MKKILFIIALGLAFGMFTNCTDLTTDLNMETNTRLVYIASSPYYSESTQYLHTWVAGEESHTLEGVEVSYFGLTIDKPLRFRFYRTNDVIQPISEINMLRVGVANVTWEDVIYEIPAGERSVTVPIKFIKDPVRVETTNGQLRAQGWTTVFGIAAVNSDESVSCRAVLSSDKVYAKEMSIR